MMVDAHEQHQLRPVDEVSKQIFVLAHPVARQRAIAAVASAPEGYVVRISEPTRSLAINAALHASLGEIAERVEWAGRKWDIETWKRLLVASWCRVNAEPAVILPALDGHGVDIVFRRTSSMTQAEMSDMLAFIDAWKAERAEFRDEAVA